MSQGISPEFDFRSRRILAPIAADIKIQQPEALNKDTIHRADSGMVFPLEMDDGNGFSVANCDLGLILA